MPEPTVTAAILELNTTLGSMLEIMAAGAEEGGTNSILTDIAKNIEDGYKMQKEFFDDFKEDFRAFAEDTKEQNDNLLLFLQKVLSKSVYPSKIESKADIVVGTTTKDNKVAELLADGYTIIGNPEKIRPILDASRNVNADQEQQWQIVSTKLSDQTFSEVTMLDAVMNMSALYEYWETLAAARSEESVKQTIGESEDNIYSRGMAAVIKAKQAASKNVTSYNGNSFSDLPRTPD